MSTNDAHTNHVLGGYKATLKSMTFNLSMTISLTIMLYPDENASEEAKAHASEVLDQQGATTEIVSNTGTGDAHTNHILGGYKATYVIEEVNNNASDQAKQHASEVLNEHGASTKPLPQSQRNEHPDHERVKAGYKAALHNPRVSDEAKQKAEEFLENTD
uniref:Conidiation-specific protein 6 n=1 Tax=Moniliophthora roreri TaxID=221103 RepID=A0A0W0G2Q2_MONRR